MENNQTCINLFYHFKKGVPRSVVANGLDCDIVVSEFELQSRYYHIYPTPPLGPDMTQGQSF